jgi:hypothetical protein
MHGNFTFRLVTVYRLFSHKIGWEKFHQQGSEFSRYIKLGWGNDRKDPAWWDKIPPSDGENGRKISSMVGKKEGEGYMHS